jgi:hypothetical protein
MPYQRALISWRNGEETMVVQSEFTAKLGRYAWVLPVPDKPKDIEAVDPMALDRLSERNRPWRDTQKSPVPFEAALGLAFAAMGILALAKASRVHVGCFVFGAVGVCAVLAVLYRPFNVFAMGATASAVSVLYSGDVGDYNVEVVRSSDSGAMAAWLKEHRMRLTPRVATVVAKYVKEGWCFVVAMLRHDDDGPAVPHPLWLTFRSAHAVYPMRLAACQGFPVTLDLFVLGDGTASCPQLLTAASTPIPALYSLPTQEYRSSDPLSALEWQGATLTGLHAELKPSDMDHDYRISFGPSRSFHVLLMARDEWTRSVLATAALWSGLALLAASLLAAILQLPRLSAVALAAVVAVAVAGIAYSRCIQGWSPRGEDMLREAPVPVRV